MKRKKVLIIDPDPHVFFRLLRFLKEKHEVSLAGGTDAVQNYYEAEAYDHLNCFDVIFLEPFMPCGIFSLKETNEGLETGWPLYNKFLRDLKNTKIVIWTYPVQDYMYPNAEHPDRKWGDNVIIRQKDGTDDHSLVKIVEEIGGSLIMKYEEKPVRFRAGFFCFGN